MRTSGKFTNFLLCVISGTVWFDVRLLHGEMDQVNAMWIVGSGCRVIHYYNYCSMLKIIDFQIREEYPLLVNQETVVARKLGFPEVIMPGKVLPSKPPV